MITSEKYLGLAVGP